MRSNFAIVISAHRMYEALPACIAGFCAMAEKPEDVVFVDNGSSDRIGEQLSRACAGVTILRLDENRFFCGGYNEGIRYALDRGYHFVLIVNADTEVVNPGFAAELLLAAARRPRAAFLGPLVYYHAAGDVQHTCLRYPGLWRQIVAWPATRLLSRYDAKQPSKEAEVEVLNGVCVLCRCAALREFGLMDETFGAYVEDVDWAWRAKSAGWTSVFVPCPSIIHHEEPTGYEHYSLKTFLLKRNTVLWFRKINRRCDAAAYAWLSLRLADLRTLSTGDTHRRGLHAAFRKRLARAYSGILKGEALGRWFGPPLIPPGTGFLAEQ